MEHVRSIMRNTTVTKAMKAGTFSVLIDRLQSHAHVIPRDKWYQVLGNLTSSNALVEDTFGQMIDELRKTKIQTKKIYKLLSGDGSSKILKENKSEFHRVLKELTDSGFSDKKFHE